MISHQLLCICFAKLVFTLGSTASGQSTRRVAPSGGVILLQGRSELWRSKPHVGRTRSIDRSVNQHHPVKAKHSLLSESNRVTRTAKRRVAKASKGKRGRVTRRRKLARRRSGNTRRRRRRRSTAHVHNGLDSVGVEKSAPSAASWLSFSGSLSGGWPYSIVPTTPGPTIVPVQNVSAEKLANITAFRKRAMRNCEVSDWSDWSDCHDDHPDDGLKAWVSKRKRQIITPPLEGGTPCPGLLMRSLCKFQFKIFSGENPYDHKLHGSWIPVPPLPDEVTIPVRLGP